MENKELRNILLNNMKLLKISLLENMKNELKDFAQIQRNLKKSRKLEFRHKDKDLCSICDEINCNKYKISDLLSYYCWIRHGLKYWSNRDVHDYWEYLCYHKSSTGYYPDSYRDKPIYWNRDITYSEYRKNEFCKTILRLIKKYNIEIDSEYQESFIEYLYKNI